MPTQVVFYSSIRRRARQDRSDLALVIWVPIILTGLAIVAIALGGGTTVEPAIFAAP
jgi:hypothetical protein